MKVLLIVDVQKTMGNWFTWSYINKLNTFLRANAKNYDRIMLTLEPNIAIDSRVFRQLKTADIARVKNILNSLEVDEVPSFLLNYLTDKPVYKMYSNQLFNRMFELGMLPKSSFIALHSNSVKGYYSMYLSPSLKGLITDLHSATQVDIVGGGVDKCVSLTAKLLTYHNIPMTILRESCYTIQYVNSNRRVENVFSTKPIKSLSKSLLDSNNNFPMTKVPLTKSCLHN